MKVSELMHTPAVTSTPTATVSAVARLMAARNVGCVVIIDNVGEIAGIVTDRDITVRGVAHGRSGDIPVEEVMTRAVASVEPTADVGVAAATMMKRRVRRLPVIDDHGHAHGVVTLDDIVRHVARQTDEVSDLLMAQDAQLPVGP